MEVAINLGGVGAQCQSTMLEVTMPTIGLLSIAITVKTLLCRKGGRLLGYDAAQAASSILPKATARISFSTTSSLLLLYPSSRTMERIDRGCMYTLLCAYWLIKQPLQKKYKQRKMGTAPPHFHSHGLTKRQTLCVLETVPQFLLTAPPNVFPLPNLTPTLRNP